MAALPHQSRASYLVCQWHCHCYGAGDGEEGMGGKSTGCLKVLKLCHVFSCLARLVSWNACCLLLSSTLWHHWLGENPRENQASDPSSWQKFARRHNCNMALQIPTALLPIAIALGSCEAYDVVKSHMVSSGSVQPLCQLSLLSHQTQTHSAIRVVSSMTTAKYVCEGMAEHLRCLSTCLAYIDDIHEAISA